jgi:hypothetical protein
MNRAAIGILTGAVLALGSPAQAQTGAQASAQSSGQASVEAGKQGAQANAQNSTTASGAAQAGNSSASLASGSTLNAALSAPVDSKKCKPGDPVTARSTEPAKSDGKTVFPKGTRFVGHVTQASSRAKGDSESAVGIVFDKAILRSGQEVPVNFAIQAIASAESGAALAGSDVDTMGGMGRSAAGSGAAGGRGALGGVASTAGGAAGTVTNTAARAGNAAGGAVNATANTAGNAAGESRAAVGGLNATGQLTSNSQGVFGFNGLNLSAAASNRTQGSVITSAGKNVHLDSGTRLLLVSQAGAAGESKQAKPEKPAPKVEPKGSSEKPETK